MISSQREARSRRAALRLGLRNGLLIGLALALGTWALQIFGLATLPTRLLYPPLILGGVALLALGGLAGWLTALAGSTLAGAFFWAGAAVLMSLVINHVPYEGHNLTIWLADRRFWGLSIFPYTEAAQVRFWLSSFFPVLLMAILGLLQDYRLEGLEAEIGEDGRLSGRGWWLLAFPALLVMGAGLIADNMVNSPLRAGPRLVHEVIRTGRTYSGDLFELSLKKGTNYNAIRGVREQMSANYTLFIAEADLGAAETVYVVADFDNGAWITCSVVAGNVSNCYDASPPYVQGLAALIIGGSIPQDCPACYARVSDPLARWLAERGENFADAPQVTRLAQRGSYVLMRAQDPDSAYAIECWFHGLIPVTLEDCWEAQGAAAADQAPLNAAESKAEAGSTALPTNAPAEPAPTAAAVMAPITDTPLALYAPAMRAAFVDDLAAVGPVAQYRIEVTVDAPTDGGTATLSGHETVHYVNNAPVSLDAVYLRLFPNLPSYGGEMTVGEVRVGEAAVTTHLEAQGTALRVPLSTPLPPGGETTVALEFETTVPITVGVGYGQLVYLQDVMALANFFPIIPAYDEENCARFGNCVQGWNIEVAVPYGDAVFSPTALFEVFVSAPDDWTVVASGSLVDKQPAADDRLTWHMVSGPMRDFNVVLSPRFEVATDTVNDVTVNSYYLPEDVLGGRRALGWVVESLAFFGEHFGPYPFAEFDVVATPTAAGGIEYPGLIVMPIRNYGDTSGRFQWSTVHEVVHQWWYSLVGNDQQDEPWVDEALAQYSTALFYERHLNWDGAVAEVFEPRYAPVAGTEEDDLINLPVADYTEANYGPLVYSKGPLFFHALRQEVGDETFDAILKSFFVNFRYGIASGQELLGLAASVSGMDLNDLYREWLEDGS